MWLDIVLVWCIAGGGFVSPGRPGDWDLISTLIDLWHRGVVMLICEVVCDVCRIAALECE